MRRIFIDLGSHIGESVKFFRKHHPQGNEFEVFCFEPLPDNVAKLEAMKDVWNISIIPKAAATYNSSQSFYTGLSESGSLSDKKRTGGLDGKKRIQVDTIDFTAWFNELVSGDYVPEIWLKMNIEGAEYGIIEKLHERGLIPFVHKWYLQWHWTKIALDKHKHDEIKYMIPQDKLFAWGAMFGDAFINEFKKSL